MNPERALIRSESAAENSTGILKIDRRKDWSPTSKNTVISSVDVTFLDGIKMRCIKLIDTDVRA